MFPNASESLLAALMEENEELTKASDSLLEQMAGFQVPLGRQFQNAIRIKIGIKSKRNWWVHKINFGSYPD